VKPVHIDDAIYLRYAQQIVQHPLDPYGFEMFWFQWPENANWVLCPIGVPYWIALGMAIFGQSVWALKLWMTPFAIGLTWSVDALLKRANVTSRGLILWMIALSPVVLPGFNLMLDVPVMALSLVSLVLMLRAMERQSTGTAVIAGLICGLAILTKWTAFLFPVLFLFLAWKYRDWLRGLLSCAVAAVVVLLWEGYVARRYGQSHLIFHLTVGDPNRAGPFVDVLNGFLPLLGAAGGVALPLLLARWGRMNLAWISLFVVPGVWIASLFVSYPAMLFGALGMVTSAVLAVSVVLLLRQSPRSQDGALVQLSQVPDTVRLSKTSQRSQDGALVQLLCAWLILELLGYFILSPFPAMRRMMGVQIAAILVAAVALTNCVDKSSRRATWATCLLTIVLGLSVNAVDYLDARALRTAATQSVRWARKTYPQARIYYAGHWGFQYYAELTGATPLVPDQTRLKTGDVLLVNSLTVGPELLLPAEKPDHTLLATDAIPLSAMPFHRYVVPLLWRETPRVQVGVFVMPHDGRVYTNRSPDELVPELAKRARYLSPGAIDAVIAGLQFGKPSTRQLAAQLIQEHGPKALLQTLDHEDPAVRLWALRQPNDSAEVEHVIARMAIEDPDAHVRKAAKKHGEIQKPEAAPR